MYVYFVYKINIKVECSSECQIAWYNNGTLIKNQSSVTWKKGTNGQRYVHTIINERLPANLTKNVFESTKSTLIFNLPSEDGDEHQFENETFPQYSCQSSSNCYQESQGKKGGKSVILFIEFHFIGNF